MSPVTCVPCKHACNIAIATRAFISVEAAPVHNRNTAVMKDGLTIKNNLMDSQLRWREGVLFMMAATKTPLLSGWIAMHFKTRSFRQFGKNFHSGLVWPAFPASTAPGFGRPADFTQKGGSRGLMPRQPPWQTCWIFFAETVCSIPDAFQCSLREVEGSRAAGHLALTVEVSTMPSQNTNGNPPK